MKATITVSHDGYLANRKTLDAWVRAHLGDDMHLVPVPSVIRIDGDRVTFERHLLNEHGNVYVPDGQEEPARGTVTVPLVEPWPFKQTRL